MGGCTSTGEQKYRMDGLDGMGAATRNGMSRAPTTDGYKLVMLGMPRCGKTTLHQQMKVIFGSGFNATELTIARTRIMGYIIDNARALVWHADRRHVETPSISSSIRRVIMRLSPPVDSTAINNNNSKDGMLSRDAIEHIQTLWSEPAIRSLYDQRAALYAEVGDTHALAVIADSTAYFMNKLHLIVRADYQPTNEDVLRCPSLSTTSPTSSDPIRNLDLRLATRTPLPRSLTVPRFRVMDAGGATHTRMQWLQCIDNVHAVLFVAALSHYDYILPNANASAAPVTESTTTMVEPIISSTTVQSPPSSSPQSSNTMAASASTSSAQSFFTPSSSLPTVRYEMMESLNLFEEVCRSPWFSAANIILILTKSDLLKDKCTTVSLRHTFPDYNGTDDYASYVDYIRQQYTARAEAGRKARVAAAAVATTPPSSSATTTPASHANNGVTMAGAPTTTTSAAIASPSPSLSPSPSPPSTQQQSSNNGSGNHSGNKDTVHSGLAASIYIHVVTATDTDMVRAAFDSIKITILGANLPATLE